MMMNLSNRGLKINNVKPKESSCGEWQTTQISTGPVYQDHALPEKCMAPPTNISLGPSYDVQYQ
jgi:hypothetical protein